MNYEFTTIITYGFAGAGFALLVQKVLRDFPKIENKIKAYAPWFITKALNCWLCSTFWFTLLMILMNDIFIFTYPAEFFITWMSAGFIAVLSRYIFVAIQQFVTYEFHVLNADPDHTKHSNDE